jgi:hypothetical protein
MSDDDETLAHMWLCGYVSENKAGLFEKHYLDSKGEAKERALDRDARAALARLLLSDKPVPRDIREGLAAVIDPKPNDYPAGDRVIVGLKFRTTSKPPDRVRDTALLQRIARLHRDAEMSVDDAIDATVKHLRSAGIRSPGRARLWQLWKAYRRHFHRPSEYSDKELLG